jgi:hypothetical protein
MRFQVTTIRVLVCVLVLAIGASAATIPAGTRVTVRLNQTVDSGKNQVGDIVDATLVNEIRVGNTVVAKAGDSVRARVTHVKDSGRLKTPGEITLRLVSINGINVKTSAVFRKGQSHTKSNVTKIGGGAAAGAVIGAIAGGGKGAAIGAGVGAGAGTGVAMATGKKQATIAAESTLTFTVAGQ